MFRPKVGRDYRSSRSNRGNCSAWTGDLDLGDNFVLTGNETVSGDVVVRVSENLTINAGVTLQGDGDGLPDSLTIISGGKTIINGNILQGGTAGGGLVALTVQAGGSIGDLTGSAIVVGDGAVIDLPGAPITLSTDRGVDMDWTAVTPFFKDKEAVTGITIGDARINGGDITLNSKATTTKFADFEIDTITMQDLTPTLTADFSGSVLIDLNGSNLATVRAIPAAGSTTDSSRVE